MANVVYEKLKEIADAGSLTDARRLRSSLRTY